MTDQDVDIVTINDYKLPPTTRDSECWSLISKWIERCETKHTTCGSSTGQIPWRPTRLLDVSPTEACLPRLVITENENVSSMGPYIALSHCWGRSKILTLKTSNIDTFRHAIPVSDLPLNFREAIQVSQNLGFKYIWIDSLCIIQDSVEDWRKEAAMMGKVYKYASLCIAATGSHDAEGGLFRKRNTTLLSPYRLNIITKSHAQSYLALRADLWSSGVTEAPLNRRAWVVQERLFAPRTLHFGREQIFWECRELEACEVLPDQIPPKFFESSDVGWELNGFKRWHFTVGDAIEAASQGQEAPRPERRSFKQDIYEPWQFVVQEYMRCGLSKPEDKFVALSGMALEMSQLLKDEYLAGL
jgi:hypothetical protein